MFPENDYTPFGYLDNPFHTWKLNRSGVIRFSPPCGFGWLFPNAHSPIYRASMNLGIQIEKQRLLAIEEWQQADVHLRCSYHSKNLFRYDFCWKDANFQIEFFLTDENVLTTIVEIDSSGKMIRDCSLLFLLSVYLDYRRTGLWDFGLTGRFDHESNSSIIKSFAEGYCFALKPTAIPADFVVDDDVTKFQLQNFVPNNAPKNYFSTRKNSLFCLSRIPIKINQQNPVRVDCAFIRGINEKQTLELTEKYTSEFDLIRDEKIKADDAFWRSCPRLEGDWPEHWKRGWIYDWETLRMNVRQPIGIFSTRWDAMQIQKPRIVLAETALDMLMMSYAHPAISEEVILGLFQDALGPQVHCAREDGSPNMISADGSECGTSPAWCFPFYCFESMVMRQFNREWLQQIYPYLDRYFNWWLKNRTDEQGWAVYNCSWESGQDASSKFLVDQATGGEIVSHLRAVDLQAAMAQSARIMSFFASCLDLKNDHWKKIYRQFQEKTLAMWQGNWFCDFDKRTNAWIQKDDWRDVTNLAPFFAGIYSTEQLTQATFWFEYFHQNPKLWLEWPSFFFMYLEACWQVGLTRLASQVLFSTVNRIYRYWDRRVWQEGEAMPGVSVECWGLEKPLFSEGYGWAATLPLHIIRSLIGYREYQPEFQTAFLLRPNLPQELMVSGNVYAIHQLNFQDKILSISYRIMDDQNIECNCSCKSDKKFNMKIMTGENQTVFQTKKEVIDQHFAIQLKNRDELRIIFSRN